MWLAAQNSTMHLPISGMNLWPLGHPTCDKTARTVSHRPGDLFLQFLLPVAAILSMFLVKLEVKSKIISYEKSRFDTTPKTYFFK